jgi:starvation-inducible DNA-binding protein
MNQLTQLLKQYQATLHAGAMNIHNLHWNLEDQLFFTLHPYLGDLYEQLNDNEDEAAEQLRFFGELPVTTTAEVTKTSILPTLPSKSCTASEAIDTALETFLKIYDLASQVVAEADATNTWAAIEKFSGHLVAYEKVIYFLRSSSK